MGKNRSKKNQSKNSSEKWEKIIDKGFDYGTKAASFAGAVFTAYAGYKGLKNQNKS